MRQFRLHGNCGLGFHWPFVLVDQFGCFDCVAVFLRLQMKTTEYSRLSNSKFGDNPTTPPLGWRAVVWLLSLSKYHGSRISLFFRIVNADIFASRIAN
jgi:hypothetical protein